MWVRSTAAVLLAALACAAAAPHGLSPRGLDADMEKLNEYIQADKVNEQSVEQLYADLQARFNGLKADMAQMEAERASAREALKAANARLDDARDAQKRSHDAFLDCRKENEALAQARSTALHALGLDANATAH